MNRSTEYGRNNPKNFPDNLSKNAELYVSLFRAYCSPLIALIGITGNFMVLFVFSKERTKSRFSIYCMMLSGVHIVILLTNSFFDDFLGRGLLYLTNNTYTNAKLDIKSNTSCKLMEYVPNAAYLASSLIVIIFSFDRILTIFRPLKFMSIHYQSWAWTSTTIVIILSCIFNSSILMIYNIERNKNHGLSKNYQKCDISRNYEKHFLQQFSLYLKVVFAFVFPNFLIICLNFIIIIKLWRVQVTRCKLLPLDSKNNNLEMSRVMGHLALSSCFILLTMPLVIVMILRMKSDAVAKTAKNVGYKNILKHLARLFSSVKDINYASDFFLYIIFLPNFRWRFLRYACRMCRTKGWFKTTIWGQKFEHNVQKFDSSISRRKLAVSGHYLYNPNVEKSTLYSLKYPFKIMEKSISREKSAL